MIQLMTVEKMYLFCKYSMMKNSQNDITTILADIIRLFYDFLKEKPVLYCYSSLKR